MTTYEGVPELCREAYDAAFAAIRDCFRAGGKLLLCGNGGSAADCEHIVGELMKGFLLPRKTDLFDEEPLCRLQGGLPAISLTGQPGLSSAVNNDLDGRLVYAQQLMGLGKPGDVLLAISTSGNAENCCLAARVAKKLGLTVIAMTGKTGGKLAGLCDILLNVPETETYKVQQLHLPLYHALCARLEECFYG